MAPELDTFKQACLRADLALAGKKAPIASGRAPLVLSSAEFTTAFTPPEISCAGILQRRFSLYQQTGAGSGDRAGAFRPRRAGPPYLSDAEVKKDVSSISRRKPGRCQMRVMAMAQQYDFKPDDVEVWFCSFAPAALSEMRDYLEGEIERACPARCHWCCSIHRRSLLRGRGREQQHASRRARAPRTCCASLTDLPRPLRRGRYTSPKNAGDGDLAASRRWRTLSGNERQPNRPK